MAEAATNTNFTTREGASLVWWVRLWERQAPISPTAISLAVKLDYGPSEHSDAAPTNFSVA